MASQIEKDGAGGVRAGNLRPEIITIRPEHNYRDMASEETKAHVGWLKNSIRTDGVKDPIDVVYSDGQYYLEAGECRLRAAQELRKEGWDGYIPCFLVKGDEITLLKRNLLRNTGLAPTLLEVGKALQHLIDLSVPMEEVVRCVPPSITTDPTKAIRIAKKALDLNAAPIEVKEAVKHGVDGVKITEPLAVKAVRESPLRAAAIVKEAAADAKAKGKTVAHRPKGAGKKTKEKQKFQACTDKLFEIGDRLAAMILDGETDWAECKKTARAWQKLRS